MNKLIELASVPSSLYLRFGYILDHHIILLVNRLIDAGFAQKNRPTVAFKTLKTCFHICLIAGDSQIEQY